jgi:uncharacterized membrane protein
MCKRKQYIWTHYIVAVYIYHKSIFLSNSVLVPGQRITGTIQVTRGPQIILSRTAFWSALIYIVAMDAITTMGGTTEGVTFS